MVKDFAVEFDNLTKEQQDTLMALVEASKSYPKVYRYTQIINPPHFEVGDIISFIFDDKVTEAIAVHEEGDGMLFIFKNCININKPMFSSISSSLEEREIVYGNSDLRRYLNTDLIKGFPSTIMDMLVTIETDDSGDLLRLATFREIFGKGKGHSGQWELMKDKRNRIALDSNGSIERWWLQDNVDPYHFAYVNNYGCFACRESCNCTGVRPVFKIINR